MSAFFGRTVRSLIQDLGAKNGTWLGGARLSSDQRVAWRATQMLKVGGTVLALAEPVADALAELEAADDEPLGPQDANPAPTSRLRQESELPSRRAWGLSARRRRLLFPRRTEN
jgi:hypothetical protein